MCPSFLPTLAALIVVTENCYVQFYRAVFFVRWKMNIALQSASLALMAKDEPEAKHKNLCAILCAKLQWMFRSADY